MTGSIAAYKSAFLVRLLVQYGVEVRVVMSKGALEFLTPLTFSTLSKHPVLSDFTESKDQGTWSNHVATALWADLIIAAPLSANTMSKMANGQCDSFLMAVYMSARCPIMLAPAMDHDMYEHGGTQDNLQKLKLFNHIILAPKEGELASGLVGKGRMMEPEEIVENVLSHFNPTLPLLGKKALVTAGPTYEKIDPVRFIGNFSSGKMGFALAENLAEMGATVVLVAGPSKETISNARIERIDVVSAAEMSGVCETMFEAMDITIMAAAVADYTPKHFSSEKIKKAENELSIELTKTIDIASTLGQRKKSNQILIGFALETENEEHNALIKLTKKNLDFIVLNSLREEGAGFGTDTNKITVIWANNKKQSFGLKPKKAVAKDIINEIVKLIKA